VVDNVPVKKRSAIMAAVRAKNTGPELALRRIVHGMGYRYRLHAKELPGRPDLVFQPLKKVIFVHGCFWHRHDACRYATTPKSRTVFWQAKFATNVARDRRNVRDLKKTGWCVLTIWQCQLKSPNRIAKRAHEFLKTDH
jgi:DNA mismatch endonuclease (patch repair protein)